MKNIADQGSEIVKEGMVYVVDAVVPSAISTPASYRSSVA
jgi:hypothetical protein